MGDNRCTITRIGRRQEEGGERHANSSQLVRTETVHPSTVQCSTVAMYPTEDDAVDWD